MAQSVGGKRKNTRAANHTGVGNESTGISFWDPLKANLHVPTGIIMGFGVNSRQAETRIR